VIVCLLLSPAGTLAASLPKDLKWQTNKDYPLIASDQAEQGGTLHDYLPSFPLTLRQVGPDSNGAFRSQLDANQMGLVTIHPNTKNWVPQLATHWAIADDGKTVFYKLNPDARWSDGKPVTAADFVFTREFMRSPHIIAPWYNEYYSEEIAGIKAYTLDEGQEVVAISLPKPKPDILYYTNLTPTPRHFYKLDKDFVKTYNWRIPPNTGPYQVTKVDKGKSITFTRKKDWWAKDHPWHQNRFNVNKVVFKVIRDTNVAFENLKKGNIEAMSIPFPDYWHDKTRIDVFKKGYIHKMQVYNDMPRGDYLLVLNQNYTYFKDRRVRLAFHYAMNVEKVIRQVLRGDYDRLQGVSRGYGRYSNPDLRARPFDLKKADELLDAAGWSKRNARGIRVKNGRTLSATVSFGQSNLSPRLVVLREEAKKAGIDLRLKQMDASALWKSYLEKKHEIALVAWAPRFRPQYWGRFHSTNADKPQTNNFSNMKVKKLDQLIETYRQSTEAATRIQKAHDIQTIIENQAAHIPLFEVPYYRLAYWGWIRFPEPPGTKMSEGLEPFGPSTGGRFWIDQKAKETIIAVRDQDKPLKETTIVDETYRRKP
jgi:microcin C transport system substrate-binding protein